MTSNNHDIAFTRNYIKKTAILFHGGTYGNFLDWCMYYFSGNLPESNRPWHTGGSSHCQYVRTNLSSEDMFKREKYTQYPVLRVHPYSNGTYCMETSARQIIEHGMNVIQLRKTLSTNNLIMCNAYRKILLKDLIKIKHISDSINEIVSMFSKPSLEELSIGQRREFLIFLYGPNYPYYDYYLENNKNCLTIDVDDIIMNFKETVKKSLKFCGLEEKRSNFSDIYAEWHSLQKDLTIDSIIRQIIMYTVYAPEVIFDWSNRNFEEIHDAALVQTLRLEHGLTIDSSVDNLPTNSRDLRKILKPSDGYVDILHKKGWSNMTVSSKEIIENTNG